MNDVLRTYYIESENSSALTKRGRKRIALETYLYYIEFLNRYITKVPNAVLLKIRFHFATSFYGIVCAKNIFEIMNEVKPIASKLLVLLMFPFAFILSKIKS